MRNSDLHFIVYTLEASRVPNTKHTCVSAVHGIHSDWPQLHRARASLVNEPLVVTVCYPSSVWVTMAVIEPTYFKYRGEPWIQGNYKNRHVIGASDQITSEHNQYT